MAVPQVAAAVFGSTRIQLAPGLGWVIEASAMNPGLFQPDAGTMLLSSSGGSWAAAFSLQLTDERGKPVPLKATLKSSRPSTPAAELGADADAEVFWLVAPEDAQFPLGRYELIATLEAPAAAGAGWIGRAKSPPVQITIGQPRSPPTPASTAHERLVKARYAQAAGDIAGARAEIDALVAAQPENVVALTVQGDLQETANDKKSALKTYELALSVIEKRGPAGPEPATYLLRRQQELSRALRKH